MPQSTRHDTKSNSREHVGIVALARIKSLSTWKGNRIKRTAAGKNGATLQHRHITVKRGRCLKQMDPKRIVQLFSV